MSNSEFVASPSIFDDVDIDLNHLNRIYPEYNSIKSSLYYNADKFNEEYQKDKSDLSVFHLNVRSIMLKADEIQAELSTFNIDFDIICFTESWLTLQSCDSVSFNNYVAYHSLRTDRRGGGISAYVSSKHKVNVVKNISIVTLYIESLFLEILDGCNRILCGIIYRPPAGDCSLFMDSLQEIITSFDRGIYKDVILCGDFNFDLLQLELNASTQLFFNTMQSYSFLPLISKPSRIADNSATLIDNIFITNPVDYISGIIISSISDHYPVFLIYKSLLTTTNKSSQISFSYRKINNYTLSLFHDSILNHDYSYLMSCTDVNAAVLNLDSILYCYFDKCCPIVHKTKSPKSILKPWIDRSLLSDIKKRQNMLVLLRANKVSRYTYNRFRNDVTSRIRSAKKTFYESKFSEFRGDMKRTWKLINDIIRPGTTLNRNSINEILVGDSLLTDDLEIATAFNDFFVDIGKNVAESVNCRPDEYKKYLNGNFVNSFYFDPVNNIEVENIVMSLKNKSCNLHSVPTSVIKSVIYIISPVLCNVINLSMSRGIFPDSLKIAKIVPIFKHGDRTYLENYRPISILPLLSKIFEKVIHKRMIHYLSSHHIIFSNQFGFLRNRSTSNAIVKFLHYLYSSLDQKNYVFSMFLDFKKAFDSVDHSILLGKLYHYGFRGVVHKWFSSYLSNRQQYVVIQNEKSEHRFITHGVPQGSILGPLLFLIFINDLPQASPFFNFILFADDSTLSCKFSPVELPDIHNLINLNLKNINNWLTANKIAVNVNKTNYIVFSYRSTITLPVVMLGDGIIKSVDHTKFLGLHIDRHLRFNYHIDYILGKLSRSIGILYRLNRFLPGSVLLSLYRSLTYPYLSYGIEAYYNTSNYLTDKLYVAQKKSIRAINNLEYNAHTGSYFMLNKILKLEDIFKLQSSFYLYRTIHSDYDPSLLELLISHNQQHNHSTRNRHQLIIPRFNRTSSQNSFIYTCVKLWNDLPQSVKDANSSQLFKSRLKKFIFDQYQS